ncbi:hypothetical protein ACFYMW_26285 [Streptomyces sp. NPDC006692]|uniref:hypothetical protein n=1 Tax=unclassified Streptomyces TaxID=2593676 RepID=UPI003426A65A
MSPTHDAHQPADQPLPEGWTIHTRTGLGLTAFALHDDSSDFLQARYHEEPTAAHVYGSLGAVPAQQRAAAQALVNDYFAGLAEIGDQAVAQRAAIADFDTLADYLHHQIPGCRIDAHRDAESERFGLTLSATGRAVGQLLASIYTFLLDACGPGEELPTGTTVDPDLPLTLHARHTPAFLDWLRSEPVADDEDGAECGRTVGEKEQAEEMARQLRRIGVEADTANTGSNCWVAVVHLSQRLHLEVFHPQDEPWSWTLHCDGEQIDVGYWPSTNTTGAARLVKHMMDSRGVIVA